jgi:hypothetical protein
VHVDVPPPTTVITSVFLTWACGTIALGAASRLWGEVQAGHFKVIWLVGTGLSAAAGFGYHPAWLLTAASLLTFFAIYRGVDRWVGSATAILAFVVLLAGVDLDLTSIAGAALLGAVTNAMLLGHWHLNQPRLGTKPILRLIYALWAGVALYAAATISLAFQSAGIAALGAWTGVIFTAFAAVLTAPVHHLVRTRSIMSATGILYLEILLCLVASFTGTLGALARS